MIFSNLKKCTHQIWPKATFTLQLQRNLQYVCIFCELKRWWDISIDRSLGQVTAKYVIVRMRYVSHVYRPFTCLPAAYEIISYRMAKVYQFWTHCFGVTDSVELLKSLGYVCETYLNLLLSMRGSNSVFKFKGHLVYRTVVSSTPHNA